MVWVVARGPAGEAFNRLLNAPGVRVLDVRAQGRVLQLHAEVLRDALVPAQARWFALRLPLAAFGMPGCG